jgi:hypothetical protein
MDQIEVGAKTFILPSQKMELRGRLQMADWIAMPESSFAREIAKLENNPLFSKLRFAAADRPVAIGRSRWPRTRFNADFYDLAQFIPAAGDRVQVEELLEKHQGLIASIKKMGREAFEHYFLYGAEALPLEEIARVCGIELGEARRVHELLLDIGAQAEFMGPAPQPEVAAVTCLASVSIENGEPDFQFFSPQWARGLYEIHYDALEQWKRSGWLSLQEAKQLPHLLRRIETINLRQNTLFRIVDNLVRLQAPYLKSRRAEHKLPLSLRRLASHLELAPSTVCRAVAGRSVKMPWNVEIQLSGLLPGRRKVLRAILSRWLDKEPLSDEDLRLRLKLERGITVSRRTVNAVRHELPAFWQPLHANR